MQTPQAERESPHPPEARTGPDNEKSKAEEGHSGQGMVKMEKWPGCAASSEATNLARWKVRAPE